MYKKQPLKTATAQKKIYQRQRRIALTVIFIIILIIAGLCIFFINRKREAAVIPELTIPTQLSETTVTDTSATETVITEASAPDITIPEIPSVSNTTSDGKLVYTDDRVPSYSGTNPQWESFHFEWNRQDNLGTMYLDLSLDAEMYRHYRSLSRYNGVENYYNYVVDPNNRAVISSIVSTIEDVANDLSYSTSAVVREIAKFSQDTIEYEYDSNSTGFDEYPRYPIETLYEGLGDCEDTSILMAAMLYELGYEVGFLHIPGHVAVALRTSDDYNLTSYYEFNGHRYLFIESTGSGWNIGDIPEEYQQVSATLYLIP